MSQLEAIRNRVQARLRAKAHILYPHPLTFVLGASEWKGVRCGVDDPQELKADDVVRLQATAAELEGISYRDLRVLRVYPGDTLPYPGATTPFDDGTMEVLDWSQAGDITGLRVGTCVLRRP